MRLVPRSLHGRMLGLSIVATLVALALAGIGIARVLERFVIQGLDQRLDAELTLLASAVGNDGRIDHERIGRVRGALDAGPRARWQIVAPGETIGSDAFPALDRSPPGPRWERRRGLPRSMEGGDGIHARQLGIETERGMVTITAAAPRAVIERPIRGALMPLLATLAVLGVVLALSTLVQLRIGLRPLRRLRDDVSAIRSGAAARLDEDQPAELRPLAIELNALVRDNEAALATARLSAANLAHALKTPVATLMLGLRDDPESIAQVTRIDDTIRHHLARARSAQRDLRSATPLTAAIDDLTATIGRLHADRGIAIDRRIDPGLIVAIDQADLDELAGNLIDNAVRHAKSAVTIRATADDRMVQLSVVDDGPGIADADRVRALAPGARLDEAGDGHGFGLTIARELALLYGGELRLEAAPGGGLDAIVSLPSARSAGR